MVVSSVSVLLLKFHTDGHGSPGSRSFARGRAQGTGKIVYR